MIQAQTLGQQQQQRELRQFAPITQLYGMDPRWSYGVDMMEQIILILAVCMTQAQTYGRQQT